MADRKDQNLDGRRRQPEDRAARFREARPEMHPTVGEFAAAIDALVDERLTNGEVEARLERVLRVKRSTPTDAQAPDHRHLQHGQGADGAQSAPTTPPQEVPQRAGHTNPHTTERLLTTVEVAALFRVDPETVTWWAFAGLIRPIRTPGGRRFPETKVRALLASLNNAALPSATRPGTGASSGFRS